MLVTRRAFAALCTIVLSQDLPEESCVDEADISLRQLRARKSSALHEERSEGSCKTVDEDSNDFRECWKAVKWAKSDGVYAHPEWFAGLTGKSSHSEFQAQMAQKGQNACPLPCAASDAAMAKCKTVTEKCWKALEWSATSGIYEHPEWYPGLDPKSSYMDYLAQNAAKNDSTDGCVMPPESCKCQDIGPDTPGKCWKSVQWAAFTGIYEHPEWFTGLRADRSYPDFQAYFAKEGQNGCPWPCPKGLLAAAPTEKYPWTEDTKNCQSDLQLGRVVDEERKGLAVDDTTFFNCPNEIPQQWPHTDQSVRSLRLFRVSMPGLSKEAMMKIWSSLKALAEKNGVKYLVGTPVTCNMTDDQLQWDLVLQFVKFIGKDRIMGLAIGNEMDLLYMKPGNIKSPECLEYLWSQQGYLSTFFKRVEEWDNVTGDTDLPVTAVFAMESMGGKPFLNIKGKAEVLPFLQGAWKKFGTRFVFTINLYPYFSHDLGKAGCNEAAEIGTKFTLDHPAGFTPSSAMVLRARMKSMGASEAKLWVGETGWAAPRAGYCALGCYEACASPKTFQGFYQNFLGWKLGDIADHVFYFTVHDSQQFGAHETFGLLSKCGDRRCKLRE
mmetsp:Transcript_2587/g.4773  ORF Transcript_2587/g.4773 Transcript_2587/m.4773 type:complete len:608 (+) Transcript_2587:29-1852(+)